MGGEQAGRHGHPVTVAVASTLDDPTTPGTACARPLCSHFRAVGHTRRALSGSRSLLPANHRIRNAPSCTPPALATQPLEPLCVSSNPRLAHCVTRPREGLKLSSPPQRLNTLPVTASLAASLRAYAHHALLRVAHLAAPTTPPIPTPPVAPPCGGSSSMHGSRRCNLRHARLEPCDSTTDSPFFLFDPVSTMMNWSISSRPREPPGPSQ